MSELFFFIAAIGALAGAAGVATLDNPFYAVLSLVGHLISLAVLFLLLRAEFIAAAQVVVYAGAVMVLYIFVVSYVGGADTPIRAATSRGLKGITALFSLAIFAELAVAVLGSGLGLLDTEGADPTNQIGNAARDGFGSPGQIGQLLLTRFLLPFELASILLLIAAVGAVTLARRRGGLETAAELSRLTPLDFVRPRNTGTMREGVGEAQLGLPEHAPVAQPEEELQT